MSGDSEVELDEGEEPVRLPAVPCSRNDLLMALANAAESGSSGSSRQEQVGRMTVQMSFTADARACRRCLERVVCRCVMALVLLCGQSAATEPDVEWPGLLGPRRDGRVDYFQPPSEWPVTLDREWQVVVGTGYATPVVVGNRVWQHARQDDHEVVWCLDAATGDVLWERTDVVPFQIGSGAEKHGKGPKSCPVYADGRLFTVSITGHLSAIAAESGDVLWQRDYDSRFGRSCPYWGAATSPIVDGDRVIMHFGTDDEGILAALDVATGDEVWVLEKHGASYSSPLVVELEGTRQVIEWNHRVLTGVDSRTGQMLWEYPFAHDGPNQNMPTPVMHQGRVLLGAENRGLHCLQPRREDGRWSVEKLWAQRRIALDMSTAVISGNDLYGMSHYGRGRLFCVDAATGDIRWQGPGRVGENTAFLTFPGHVVALADSGELRIIAATPEKLTEVASWRVADDLTWAPPVLLRNGILVKDLDTLTRWTFSP